MKTRVNKKNKPKIEKYIIKQFNMIVKWKGEEKFIRFVDLWNTESKVMDKFNITDYMSKKIIFDLRYRLNIGIFL